MKATLRDIDIVKTETEGIMPQNLLIQVIVAKNSQLTALLCELKNKTCNNGQHEINYAEYAGKTIDVGKLLGFVGSSSKKSFSDGTTVIQLLKIACQEVYQDAKFFVRKGDARDHLKTHYGDRTDWDENTASLLEEFEGTSFVALYDKDKQVLDKDYVLGLKFKNSIDLKDSLNYPSVADGDREIMKKKLIEPLAIRPSATGKNAYTPIMIDNDDSDDDTSQTTHKKPKLTGSFRTNNAEASSSKDKAPPVSYNPFCSGCGTKRIDGNFCSICGTAYTKSE